MRQKAKYSINTLLKPLGLKLEGLASDREREERINRLWQKGHFTNPVFPVPKQFSTIDTEAILSETRKYKKIYESFSNKESNSVAYTFDNDYFSSPDAEILYALIRKLRPNRIIEVGSGNSTKISRMAINDEGLETELISIDPRPRTEINDLSDVVIRAKLEELDDYEVFSQLQTNDILFIDSSHTVEPGGDVVELYCRIIPTLSSGVLIHIHDIFLPWEYPEEWLVKNRWDWTEQYIVQSLLYADQRFKVTWAGFYLQNTLHEFSSEFPNAVGKLSQSLWIEII